MFGSKHRREKREQEIRDAVQLEMSRRTDFMDALHEVLNSPTQTTLRAEGYTLDGGNGQCEVTSKYWYTVRHCANEMVGLQKKLGKGFTVSTTAMVTVSTPTIGAQLDRLTGFSTRTHAVDYSDESVVMHTQQDIDKNAHLLDKEGHCWILITRK